MGMFFMGDDPYDEERECPTCREPLNWCRCEEEDFFDSDDDEEEDD